MQQVVFSLEGVVRQFLVDDKGTVLVRSPLLDWFQIDITQLGSVS